MDQATVASILSRVAPPSQGAQGVANALASRGSPPPGLQTVTGVGSGAGGGGGGIADLIGAVMRRIASGPPPTAPPGMVPAPYGGGDRTFMSPRDHIGLSELGQGSLLDQTIRAMQPPPVGGPDTTARLTSPNDHLGLSELAQGSLLDQVVRSLQQGRSPMPGGQIPVRGMIPR
jgi:hypothetical protein